MGLEAQISLQELYLLWRPFLLSWVCPLNSLPRVSVFIGRLSFFANVACEGNCMFSNWQLLLQVSVTSVQINPLPCKQGFYKLDRWQKKGGCLGLFHLFYGRNYKARANLRILLVPRVGVTSQVHSTGTRAKCCKCALMFHVTCTCLRIKKRYLNLKSLAQVFQALRQFSRFSYLPAISHLCKGKICRGKICQQ